MRWYCRFCGGRIDRGLFGIWWHRGHTETIHVARPTTTPTDQETA